MRCWCSGLGLALEVELDLDAPERIHVDLVGAAGGGLDLVVGQHQRGRDHLDQVLILDDEQHVLTVPARWRWLLAETASHGCPVQAAPTVDHPPQIVFKNLNQSNQVQMATPGATS